MPLLVTLDHFLTCGPSAWPIRCLSAEPNICHQKRSGEGVEKGQPVVCGSGRARVSSRGEEAQLLVSLGQNLETLKAQAPLLC